MPTPRRGEIWQADLGMVAKVRPVLILNVPFQVNERAVYAVVPHTTATRGGRFEIEVAVPGLSSGAFDVQGLRNIPAAHLILRLGALSPGQLIPIEASLRVWLGIR